MNICIYGASSAELKKIYYEKTEELGQLMGKRGHGLVFGGGKEGLMGAAARGVDREKGYILGIAPRFFDKPGVLYEHCTEFIFTENMRERKHLLESRSDATIVVPGGIGTYEEFFEILTLKSLGRIDRPIVLYNIQGYYDSMRALLEYTAGEKFMSRDVVDMCRFMKDPEEILDDIEDGIRGTGGQYVRIADRREAVRYAMAQAMENDMLVLAGKGHEAYQEIRGVRYPLSEYELVEDARRSPDMGENTDRNEVDRWRNMRSRFILSSAFAIKFCFLLYLYHIITL